MKEPQQINVEAREGHAVVHRACTPSPPQLSQLRNPPTLQRLHAWSELTTNAVLCNAAEARDLPGKVLCARERSRLLFLHLGRRPAKWVSLVGMVVGCERREDFMRVLVDDGTAVIVVRHYWTIDSMASPRPTTLQRCAQPPSTLEKGVPPAYRKVAAPVALPAPRQPDGRADDAERARRRDAAAARAYVKVGTTVRVCAKVKRHRDGSVTCFVASYKGRSQGGHLSPASSPNAAAKHIIHTAEARRLYTQPFNLACVNGKPAAPAAPDPRPSPSAANVASLKAPLELPQGSLGHSAALPAAHQDSRFSVTQLAATERQRRLSQAMTRWQHQPQK